MIGKFYAIKDEKSINTGTVISTLFAVVVSGGCYFLGGFGRLFDGPEIYDKATGAVVYDSIIPHMLSALPDILIGIVVVLVLSASMSTLSSLVLTSSSTLTLDLLKDNVMKNMTEKKQIITMQALIVFFIVISVVIALDPPTFIAQLMGISWGALAGAFLAPFLYGLYWKGVTRAGVVGRVHRRSGADCVQYVYRIHRIPDQRGRSGNGSRSHRSAGGQPDHAEAEERKSTGSVRVL